MVDKMFEEKSKDWLFFIAIFYQKLLKGDEKYKSVVISLLLASLNKVSQGQIIMNQKQHYDKIMSKLKDIDEEIKKYVESLIPSH